MKRLLLAPLLLLLPACGSSPAAPPAPVEAVAGAASGAVDLTTVTPLDGGAPQPQLPVTVASADGREVTVTDTSRLLAVSLSGSLAEVVVTLGLADSLVGRDIASTFPQVADLPLVTQAHDLSAEGVLALAPTLVLADRDIGPPEALDQLRASGIPVVLVEEATDLAGIAPRIEAVAAAVGVPEAGARLVERTRADLAAALESAPGSSDGPRVAMLYLRGSAGVYLMAGDGSGADSMIEAAGAVDAGSAIGLERFRPITSEALVNAAPDVLLLMTGGLESVGGVDGLLELPGMAQTPAGQARRVVAIDDASLLSFGPRTGLVVRELARQVHG